MNENVEVKNPAKSEAPEISILQLVGIIKHKIGWVFLFALVALGLALAYLRVTVPTYEATATALVDPISSNASSIESLLSSSSTASTNIATEVQLVTSNKTLNDALDLLDLDKYVDSDGILYSQKDWSKVNLSGKVSVSTVNSTKVVSITVTDQNPQFCADYANAIATSYTSLLSGIARNSKSAQREFLENQIPVTEELLAEASDELASYRETSGVIQMTEKSSILTKSISSYQLMTEPLKLQLVEDESLINDLSASIQGLPSLEEVSANEQVQAILQEYKSNDTELGMYSSLEENTNTSRVYVLESALSAKEKNILELVNSMGSNTSAPYSKAVTDYLCIAAKISVLEEMEEKANEELSEYPVLERKLQELQRAVEIYESLLLKLREMLEEAKMLEAAVVGNVTVVDEAQVPSVAVKPKKLMILALGILAGVVAGVFFVLLLSLLDNTVQTEDDIKQVFGNSIPLLGWTYYLKNLMMVKREMPGLVVYNSPSSFYAERFTGIANNILYSTPKKLQVISINSTEMNEGKTSVVCNVAAAYAMVGKKVLIVDCDFRKPAVETFFNLKTSKVGLVDAVVMGNPLEQCIFQPLSDLPNLHILPPGRGTRNPNALFSSAEFAKTLEKLRKVYDYIIIDSPPLSYGSEFTNLAKNLDGFVLDIRAGVSTKNSLYAFAQGLCFLQVPVLGYVFYDVIPRNHSLDGSSYGYGYGYGYGKKNYYYSKKNSSNSLYEAGSGSYKRIYKMELKNRAKTSFERAEFPKKAGKLAFANGLEGAFGKVDLTVGAGKAKVSEKNLPADKTMDMLSEIEDDYKKS